jgi:hypothetical protein
MDFMLYVGSSVYSWFCETDYEFYALNIHNGEASFRNLIRLNISNDGWNVQVFRKTAELHSNGKICTYTHG